MFSRCSASGKGGSPEEPVGLLHIYRDDIIQKEYLQRHDPELPLWVPDAAATAQGQGKVSGRPWVPDLRRHPLLEYSGGSGSMTAHKPEDKLVLQPQHTMRIHLHFGDAVQGARVVQARRDCARFLHIGNMFSTRILHAKQEDLSRWMWPARQGR